MKGNPKLAISFSGGRSSAVMTRICLTHEKYKDFDKVVCFANTGWEHPATLDFVRDCDAHWGFNTVWLEAVVSDKENEGIRHKVVDYKSASRSGGPFKAVVAKYGLPNKVNKYCTRALKLNPQDSYLSQLGWGKREKGDFFTAIGIRADEIDRFSSKADEHKLLYPLAEMGITKAKVNMTMSQQPWDLQLPSDAEGNCRGCWKKSDRKLFTLAKTAPDAFDIAQEMERNYGHVRTHYPDGAPYKATSNDGRRHMYRGHRDSSDILRQAKELQGFRLYTDQIQVSIFDALLDIGGSCDQGCEIFHD